MNIVTYKFAYWIIALLNRYGHHVPMFVLKAFDNVWLYERDVIPLLNQGLITADQFDVLVDRRIALCGAIERKICGALVRKWAGK